MIKLVEYLVKQLVDSPDSVKVEEKEENGVLIYHVVVDVNDRGRVIGREGKTIKALRLLVNAASSKVGRKAVVKVVD